MIRDLVFNIKGRTEAEGVWEQGAENMWTEQRWSDTKLAKTA
jgi:hypothetical protein